MKKRLLFFGLVFSLFACRKDGGPLQFELNYSSSFDAPAANVPAPAHVSFETPDIATESSSKFGEKKTASNLIDEITLSKLTINSQHPMDWLNTMDLFIKAEGLSEVKIATVNNNSAAVTQIQAQTTGANVKEYLFKSVIKIRVDISASKGLAQDEKITLNQTYLVKGKKLK